MKRLVFAALLVVGIMYAQAAEVRYFTPSKSLTYVDTVASFGSRITDTIHSERSMDGMNALTGYVRVNNPTNDDTSAVDTAMIVVKARLRNVWRTIDSGVGLIPYRLDVDKLPGAGTGGGADTLC